MTVSTAPTPLTYSGDGSTTAFPITWKYNAKSHVVATLRSSAGVETVWVLTTNYTLTDPGTSGTLTALVAPALGETLVITLEPPNTQASRLPLGGDFPSPTVEDGLDLTAQRDAKIEALFNRSLRVPKTDTQSGSDLEIPIDSERASKFLAFDADGNPIAAAGTGGGVTISAAAATVLDDSTVADMVSTLGAASLTTTNVFTKTQTWKDGGDTASAAALTLGDGNVFNITGVTAITSIVTKGVGTVVILRHNAAHVLTHHSTDLVNITGANITTAAGDFSLWEEYATGDWRMVNYARADGTPVGLIAATQAQIEAGSANTAYATPANIKFNPGVAKAWVNFNGTGTIAIRASLNVTSITDGGAGLYTVNFTTALSADTYCSIANCSGNIGTSLAGAIQMYSNNSAAETAPTTSAAFFHTMNSGGAAIDPKYVMYAAFGDFV